MGNKNIVEPENSKDVLTYEDFENYLPNYPFEEKQVAFFKYAFEMVTTNRDTTKVTCFSHRPGIGKSTFIKAFMHCCIGDYFYCARKEPIGLVVITDAMRRLEDLADGDRDRKNAEEYWGDAFVDFGMDWHFKDFEKNVIILRSDMPFMKQLIQQHYKPIVLLSTQRYFMLSETVREQLFTFSYNGKTLKRDTILFDECPYFSETISINSVNLTRIESALYEGLSNKVADKEFTIREFKVFKDRLLDRMDEKEKLLKDSNVTLYWKDERYSSITPNDKLFFQIITENMESLTAQYNAIYKDLLCLKEIAQKGAIFNCIKKKKKNEKYERSLIMLKDNRDFFYLGQDKKFFVFDATADVDPRYDRDYVEVITKEEFNKPLNMKITNVKMPTSKNAICNGTKASFTATKAITDYLKDESRKGITKNKEILIVTYSDLVRRFTKEFSQVGYFGNLKGFNDYKDMCKMAHIGVNRYPNIAYFYMYCGCHMELLQNLEQMTEKESINFFDAISKNQNKEFEEIITDVMVRSIMADFEQNIFRLAIRNYSNTERVLVFTFYNSDSEVYRRLSELIEERYKPYGVKFEYEDKPGVLKIEKIKSRKPPEGKKMTNAQKVIEWIEALPENAEYRTKDILEGTGLNNKQFQKAKAYNNDLTSIFETDKTNKKGYYIRRK